METEKEKKQKKIVNILLLLLPILITISTILAFIFFLIEKDKTSDDEPYSEILASIDFKDINAAFNDEFIFISESGNDPKIIVDQGLELKELNEGIKISVPTYSRKISLEIVFTDFQNKPHAIEETNQKNYKIEYEINNIKTTHFEFDATHDETLVSPAINHKNIEYLLFSFQKPHFIINNETISGFLYIGEVILKEVN